MMLAVCMGMPRSGSTLQYNMVSTLVEMDGAGKRKGYIYPEEWTAWRPHLIKWANRKAWYVVKCHEWMPFDRLPDERLRFFYIERNPIDVAKSLNKMFGLDCEEIARKIIPSVEVWNQLQGDERSLVQHYAEIIEFPRRHIEEIAIHLDLKSSSEIIDEVHNATKPSALKKVSHSPRRRLVKLLNKILVKSRVSAGLGSLLRALHFPSGLYFKLRALSRSHDSKTLLFHGHVSPKGEHTLTELEQRKLIESLKGEMERLNMGKSLSNHTGNEWLSHVD